MLLKDLASAWGVTGQEGEVRAILKKEIGPYVDEIRRDGLNSMIAVKNGRADLPKVMICAHMDEVGFLITEIHRDGTLGFESLGRIDLKVDASKTIYIGKNRIHGVIRTGRSYRESYIDIGARSSEEAGKHVRVGDGAIFTTRFEDFGDGRIKSKALDDRTGCGVLAETLKNHYEMPVYGVFSVQEEIGERGAFAAAGLVRPDIGIVLEGTVCSNVSVVEPYRHSTSLGEGPAISIADRTSHFDLELSRAACKLAEKNGVPFQRRRITGGGNDGGAIHTAGSGARCITISVPCRYIHSPICETSMEDFRNTIRLVDLFLKEIESGRIGA
ncbi:MAG TPA: M42 family peptidase [Clostridia bacterium]|nr:M42 family peptidase [Clostridia bacterium]